MPDPPLMHCAGPRRTAWTSPALCRKSPPRRDKGLPTAPACARAGPGIQGRGGRWRRAAKPQVSSPAWARDHPGHPRFGYPTASPTNGPESSGQAPLIIENSASTGSG